MTPEQLKASILQRAMEGKLVPQDPTDEPASELLKRIKAEKEKLIADGKIKRDKKETELFRAADGKPYEKLADGTVQEIEVPYDIPDSWEWVRLASILDVRDGTHNTPKYVEKGVPLLTSKNLVNGKILKEPSQLISIKDSIEINKRSKVDENDILLAMIGTVGNPVLVPKLDYDFSVKNVAILKHNTELDMKFTYYFIHYHSIELKRISSGAVQNFVSLRTLRQILSPLPPLSEQKRIVEQIERALEKVDAYSESYNKLQELDKSFPDKLKKSILQYAMQGKLVPQDPNDEPVEVLLEKIQAEKQKLYEEGKLKKKDLAEIVVTKRDDNSPYKEVPYSIPKSWKWVKLNDITSYIQRGKSPKYSTIPKYPVIAQKCNQWSGFSIELAKFVSPDTVDSYQEERLLKDGDLMWNSTGLGTLGRLAIYSEVKNPYGWAVADSHVTIIRLLLKFIDYHFIYYFLASPIVQNVIEEQASGSTKQKELATTTVKNYLIPLPPLTEQQRIVSKISQVFSVIESLV
ncbi:restriction endonuclease subunit S [Streptococcus suis]|uniref:restriction endonuclease subunit S n=1 Tax=Streptococcus suis TaxID=1307 RepID=UPI001C961354|nr:restriction endonuclease subunit S [Streptococcus suis]MBY5011013.1 restriction endonuclease subunit S [Streptococcus suis]